MRRSPVAKAGAVVILLIAPFLVMGCSGGGAGTGIGGGGIGGASGSSDNAGAPVVVTFQGSDPTAGGFTCTLSANTTGGGSGAIHSGTFNMTSSALCSDANVVITLAVLAKQNGINRSSQGISGRGAATLPTDVSCGPCAGTWTFDYTTTLNSPRGGTWGGQLMPWCSNFTFVSITCTFHHTIYIASPN